MEAEEHVPHAEGGLRGQGVEEEAEEPPAPRSMHSAIARGWEKGGGGDYRMGPRSCAWWSLTGS